MTGIERLLTELENAIPQAVGNARDQSVVGVTSVSFNLPVESRIKKGATLFLSPPRGTMSTGFDPPHGRLRVNFIRGDR